MQDSIPIIVAFVTAVFGLITWTMQRTAERRLDERRRKEDLYARLVESIVELSSYGNSAPFLIESQQAWLYASDEVLEAINEYLAAQLENPVAGGEMRDDASRELIKIADARIRLAIRRDLFGGTRLNEDWVESKWMPVAAPEKNIREYLERRNSR